VSERKTLSIFRRDEDQAPWLEPKAGYRFTEMFNFWAHVVSVSGGTVIVEEYMTGQSVPADRKLRIFGSVEEFSDAYRYVKDDPKSHHWVHFLDDKAPISHWSLEPRITDCTHGQGLGLPKCPCEDCS
jgi:hypothetical protein